MTRLIFALCLLLACGPSEEQIEADRFATDSLEARLDSLVLELKIKDIDLKFQTDILAADLWRAHIRALHAMAVSGLSLQTQIDSLEAKLKRAHVVTVRDSVYGPVNYYGGTDDLMGHTTWDSIPYMTVNKWSYFTHYIISFDPE